MRLISDTRREMWTEAKREDKTASKILKNTYKIKLGLQFEI